MPRIRYTDQPPPNPAKALALDTRLPTPTGWTTMGQAGIGDRLLGVEGRPCTVRAKSPIFTGKPCYEFIFAGGGRVVCSADHLWSVAARKRRGGTMPAAYIAETWQEGATRRPVYRATVAAPIDLPPARLPVPPYVLGAWLGDGHSDGEGHFSCGEADDELLGHITAEGYRAVRHEGTRCHIHGLRGQLHALGVVRNKHIPVAYMRGSREQRLALLQGLMDTDGTVGLNRTMRPCSFCTKHDALARQVVELLASLGWRSRVSGYRARFNGTDHGLAWRVEFYPGDADVFRLSRKRNRLAGAGVAERQRWRTLVDVRCVPPVPTQCIAVDAPDQLFLVGEHFIPTHHTA